MNQPCRNLLASVVVLLLATPCVRGEDLVVTKDLTLDPSRKSTARRLAQAPAMSLKVPSEVDRGRADPSHGRDPFGNQAVSPRVRRRGEILGFASRPHDRFAFIEDGRLQKFPAEPPVTESLGQFRPKSNLILYRNQSHLP